MLYSIYSIPLHTTVSIVYYREGVKLKMTNWIYQNEVFDQDTSPYTGFVYIIENLKNNRKYIRPKEISRSEI
jgi:hypothetical protein